MIRARTEIDLKEKVEVIFSKLGLNMTSALNLFLKQVVLHKGLPFDVRIPNKKTIKAIEEARKTVKKSSKYKNADELFVSLNKK